MSARESAVGADVLRALLDDAPQGLLAVDENGTILEANAAAARILGRDPRRIRGKQLAAFVDLQEQRAFRHALGAAAAGEQARVELTLGERRTAIGLRPVPTTPLRIAVTLDAPEGAPAPPPPEPPPPLDRFFLRLPYAAIGFDGELRVVFANGHARRLLGPGAVRIGWALGELELDLDVRALAERLTTTRTPLHAQLVELPDGRTLRVSGVAPQWGQPAVLMLEDVTRQSRHDRVMHEFLRNAAHQLRTPLTGITTAVEVLQAGAKEVPADRDRFLEHIELHAARLTRLARGLLVLARAQSGEQPLRVDLVELGPLLETVTSEAPAKDGVEVQVWCPPGLAALAEADLAQEALSALLENAIHHTAAGVVRVRAEGEDGSIAVAVTNPGPAPLAEHHPRLFEPFYRVGAGNGFGLGLAIAAQAAEAMRGELDVSETDGTTTFSLRLPSAGSDG